MDRWVQYRHVHDQETTERWGKRTNLTSLQLNPGCKENTSKLRQLHCSQREYLQWVLTVHLVHKHLFQWLRHYFTYTFTGILTTYWLCIWQSLAELITSQVLRSLRSLDVNQKGPLASPRVESEGWRRKGRWMASEPPPSELWAANFYMTTSLYLGGTTCIYFCWHSARNVGKYGI